jgi:hypothetical protein
MSGIEVMERSAISATTPAERSGGLAAKQRAAQAAGGELRAAGGATAPMVTDKRAAISARYGEKQGINVPHDDPRNAERAGSLQIPKREQSLPGPEITEDQGLVVSRSELVSGVSTGESMKMQRMLRESPVKFLGIPIEDRRKLETGEAVFLTAETVRKADNFLRTYVRSWNELAKQNAPPPAPGAAQAANMYDYLMENPAYAADKAILDKLSKSEGPNARGIVDEKGFRDFLSNSSSWGEVALAIDRFTILAEVGTGIQTVINNPIYNRPRNEDPDRRAKVILADDLKTIRAMMKSGTSNVASIAGAIAYYGFGGRGTTEADMSRLAEIVEEAKVNLSIEDRAVFKAVARLDLENIGVVGGRIVMINNSPSYIEPLEQEIAQAMNLKTDINVSLGLGEYPSYGWFTRRKNVKRYTPDMLQTDLYREEQGFGPGKGGGTPDGSRLITDVQARDEYSRLVREAIAATGAEPSPFERRVMLMQAVEIVSTRWATARVERETRARDEAREADSLKALDAKQTAMESGEFRKNRIDAALDRKNKADKEREGAEGRREALKTLGEKEIALNQRQAELLSTRFSVAYAGGDIDAAVNTRINAIVGPGGEIALLLASVVEPGPPPLTLRQVQAQRDTEISAREDTIRTGWQTAIAGKGRPAVEFPQAAYDAVKPALEAQYAARYAEIGRLAELQKLQQDLNEKHAEFGKARDDLQDAVLTIRAGSRERNPVTQANDARTAVLAGAPAGPGLTPGQINDFSAQQVAEALSNVAPPVPPAPPHPWGTTDADRMRYALRAKTGEEMDRSVMLNNLQTVSSTFLAGLGTPINIDDALRMSETDVVNAIIAAGGIPAAGIPDAGGIIVIPGGTPALDVARWAREAAIAQRRGFEYASINQDEQKAEADIRAADEQLRNLRNLEVPQELVKGARAVLRRAADDSLYSETRSIVDIPQGGMGSAEDRLVTELGNVDAIAATDNRVSDAERDAGYVQGLTEWYAYLYPGFKDADRRQELFQGFMRSLPPRRLAQIIGTEIGYTPAAGVNDQEYVRRVLTRFRNRSRGALAAPRPTQAQMIRIVRTMVNDIREAAGAV